VNGNTDSEWAFAVFLSQLRTPLQAEPFCHQELKEAVVKTIAKLNAWIKDAANAMTPTTPGSLGIATDDGPSMMNFAVTDGVTVVCSRYISSRHLEAASLYYSSGNRFEKCNSSQYRMVKDNRRQDMVLIASEPLTFEKADWLTIPTNSIMVVTCKMNVLIYPVVDEYHNPTLRGRGGVEQDIPISIATLIGENREDGARDTENREVVFVEGQVQRPTALSIETNILPGSLRSIARDPPGFDSGSSAPSTPASSTEPSSSIPSSPSASSMSLSTESLCLISVPGYNKPQGEDSVDADCNGSDLDHGHEADNNDDDSDDEIEADYRIFPSKRRALSGLTCSSSPTTRFGSPTASSPVAAVTKAATVAVALISSIERNAGRGRSSSVFLPH
jgi:hypothetical protein